MIRGGVIRNGCQVIELLLLWSDIFLAWRSMCRSRFKITFFALIVINAAYRLRSLTMCERSRVHMVQCQDRAAFHSCHLLGSAFVNPRLTLRNPVPTN